MAWGAPTRTEPKEPNWAGKAEGRPPPWYHPRPSAYAPPPAVPGHAVYSGTGRRKSAHATAVVTKTEALDEDMPMVPMFTVNGKPAFEYFPRPAWLADATAPVVWATGAAPQTFHVKCKVRGGIREVLSTNVSVANERKCCQRT